MSETPPPGWGQPPGPPPGAGPPPIPPGGGAPSGGWGHPGGYGAPPGGPGPGGPSPGGYGAPPEQFGYAGGPPPGQQPEKGKGLVIGLIVLIVLVIIGGLGAALLIFTGDDDDDVVTPTATATPAEETVSESDVGAAPAPGAEGADEELTPPPTAAPTPSPFDLPAEEQPPAPVDGVDQSVFELTVGTCFNDPGSADAIQSVGAVPCETPHDNEVFGLVEFPAGPDEPFPGREPLSVYGDEQCQGQLFADYVGIEYANSRYFASQLTPTDGSWEQGDREIVCVLYDTTTQITGSVRGTAQ